MTTTVPWLEDVAARNRRPVMIAAMFTDPNDPECVMREFGEIKAEALTRGVPLRFSYHSFEQMRVKDAPNPKFKS